MKRLIKSIKLSIEGKSIVIDISSLTESKKNKIKSTLTKEKYKLKKIKNVVAEKKYFDGKKLKKLRLDKNMTLSEY